MLNKYKVVTRPYDENFTKTDAFRQIKQLEYEKERLEKSQKSKKT